jgi:hypothetical protein
LWAICFFKEDINSLSARLLFLEPFFYIYIVTSSFFDITCMFTRSSNLTNLSFNCSWILCTISSEFMAIS